MAIDFSKYKAKLEALDGKKSGGKNNDLFWKPEVGTHNIRILPAEDGDPIKELHFHYNIDRGGVMCPKRNFGDHCPVCEFATSLYREGTPDSQDQAKKLFVTQRYYAAAIIRGKEERGPVLWSFPKTAYRAIIETILDEDYGDVTDPKKGFDLKVTYINKNFGKGDRVVYDNLQARPRPTGLSDDDAKSTEWMGNDIDVHKIFERKSSDEVQKVLDRYLMPDGGGDRVHYGAKPTAAPKTSSVDEAFAAIG
tara:strand:- start:628 stop:1380 length:753 start_codon:yes stop_codon:yes gene_type:complete